MNSEAKRLAKIVWNYHLMRHKLRKAEAIFVLCSWDELVARYAAELFFKGWAPILIFSGKNGGITKKLWRETEAEYFAKIAIKMGVPKDKIIIEKKSRTTGENVLYTKKLLREKGINPKSFILVQKPYMERRTYATFKKLWPGKPFVVASPRVSFEKYLERYSNQRIPKSYIVSAMVGDLQRLKMYPELFPKNGYQIGQNIPPRAWSACEKLVAMGYNERPIK